MMCYKDKTFCSGDGCTKFDKCDRALTEDVRARARSLDLLICQITEPKEQPCWEGDKNDIHVQSGNH